MFRTVPVSIIISFSLYTQQYLQVCVQFKTPDDVQRKCPKHVEFYSKNKFEKLCASGWFRYKKKSEQHYCKQLRLCTETILPCSSIQYKLQNSPVLQFLHKSRTTVTGAQTKPYRCPVPNSYHPYCEVLLSKTVPAIKALLQNVLTRSRSHPASHSNSNEVSLIGIKQPRIKLTGHLLLVPRISTSGAIPLLLLGASMECTETTFLISIDFLGERRHTDISRD